MSWSRLRLRVGFLSSSRSRFESCREEPSRRSDSICLLRGEGERECIPISGFEDSYHKLKRDGGVEGLATSLQHSEGTIRGHQSECERAYTWEKQSSSTSARKILTTTTSRLISTSMSLYMSVHIMATASRICMLFRTVSLSTFQSPRMLSLFKLERASLHCAVSQPGRIFLIISIIFRRSGGVLPHKICACVN